MRLSACGLLRARVLPSVDGVARVALVPTAASLLAGDHGARAPDDRALQLAGPGSVWPVPARTLAAAERIVGPALQRWRHAARDGPRPRKAARR